MDHEKLPNSSRLAGIKTAAELLEDGLTAPRIRSMVRSGALIAVRRGIYARAEPAAALVSRPYGDRMLRAAAAVTAYGAGTVASHQDAAVIHGLALLDRPDKNVIAVSRPLGAGGGRTGAAGVRVHNAAVPRSQVQVCGGVPVTTAARTVVDLARTIPFRAGVVTADSALHTGKATKAGLIAVIGTMPRWPGIDRARRVVAFANGLAESPLESIARVAFDDWGLPAPQLQVDVGGEFLVGRADFLWAEHNTIAEADGAAKYADPRRAIAQLERDALLRAAGFEIVHFTWADLHFRPDQVRRWILEAFQRQAALRGIGSLPGRRQL